jgi:hypothetical protein
LAYFYGWTNEYIETLEYVTALEYFNAIDMIEAQDCLIKMQLQDYPRMNKDSRRKLHRTISKKAYPKEFQKEMSFEDFARELNG